jgi:hypothetical protein
MHHHTLRFSSVLAAMVVGPCANAEDLRDFCANRPGLGTPSCVIDKGHAAVEVGLADWTREHDSSSKTDTWNFGELVLRYGLTNTLEVDISWDGYGIARSRDRDTNDTERTSGGGDVTFALRQNILNPDGSGTSLAVMPYVSTPTGSDAFSAGDWGAGVVVPVSFDIGHGFTLAFSPQIDAAVDGDGDGRHLAYGSVAGLGFGLTDNLSATIEASLARDRDPDGATTEALAGLSFAWKPQADLQFDVGVVAGLNDDSPDAELYAGVARRF